MKNIKISILSLCFTFCSLSLNAQELFGDLNDSIRTTKPAGYKMKPNTKEIDANFLSSYYQQDGNHSPVTGGEGTEALHDFSNVIIINIPVDSINSVSVYGGADAYTSASTDNIDSNVSSASVNDTRGYMTLGYQHKNLKRFETYGARAGFSKEFDYTSFSAGLNYTKEWNEGNTELNLNAQAFIDRWKIIYPELWLPSVWNDNYLTNPNRNSFNAQVFFSQIISPRLILGLSAEMIYMTGLLSTPFHSVYFSDQPDWMLDIERLPSSRLKIPLGIRLNYFPLDFLVLRTNYRFYTDDFGIKAHSIEIEAPLKLSGSFTVSPFYRYHTQTASKYFAPKFMHLSTEEYYTSDYDLSALHSHKIGLGIKYYPLMGILRSKPVFSYAGIDQYTGYKGLFMLKYIELRSAYYTRSTDLNAFNISINLGFSIK